jgi:hypothetical protein
MNRIVISQFFDLINLISFLLFLLYEILLYTAMSIFYKCVKCSTQWNEK